MTMTTRNFSLNILKMHKILIIEDDTVSIKYLDILFKRLNIDDSNLIYLENGDKVMELLNDDIGLILIDLTLPGKKSGMDLLIDIRKISDVPIIIETAQSMVGTREMVLEAGANDYLAKPFRENEFNDVVEKYLW